jgi:hypothetical protein
MYTDSEYGRAFFGKNGISDAAPRRRVAKPVKREESVSNHSMCR